MKMNGKDSNSSSQDVNQHVLAQSVSAGYEHDCAIMIDGSSKCWGENDYGQVEVDYNLNLN